MWDFDTGIYTDEDGVEWQSIGYLDFGNNQEYEIVCRKDRKRDDKDFQLDQFPVFLATHEDPDEPMIPLAVFLKDLIREQPHHLNSVVIQVGTAIAKY